MVLTEGEKNYITAGCWFYILACVTYLSFFPALFSSFLFYFRTYVLKACLDSSSISRFSILAICMSNTINSSQSSN